MQILWLGPRLAAARVAIFEMGRIAELLEQASLEGPKGIAQGPAGPARGPRRAAELPFGARRKCRGKRGARGSDGSGSGRPGRPAGPTGDRAGAPHANAPAPRASRATRAGGVRFARLRAVEAARNRGPTYADSGGIARPRAAGRATAPTRVGRRTGDAAGRRATVLYTRALRCRWPGLKR